MRTRTYLILWTALVIGVVLVVVLAGCSSEPKPKRTSDFQLTATANAEYNASRSSVSKSKSSGAGGTSSGIPAPPASAAMLTATAKEKEFKYNPSRSTVSKSKSSAESIIKAGGVGGTSSRIPAPPRSDPRSTNPKAVPNPKPTVNKEEGWSNPETVAKYILATAAAENPAPSPTFVFKTSSKLHAGIKADEAIALVKEYLRRKPYPGENRVYKGESCGWIWVRDKWHSTTWNAVTGASDSAWLVVAQNSGNLEWDTATWLVYPRSMLITQYAPDDWQIDQAVLEKRC